MLERLVNSWYFGHAVFGVCGCHSREVFVQREWEDEEKTNCPERSVECGITSEETLL